MHRVTYRELMEHIKALPESMLDDNASISIYDEYYTVKAVTYADENTDVLDNGHMFLVINEDGED